MEGFFHLRSAAEFRTLLEGFTPVQEEHSGLDQALHRILARDIPSLEDLPPFSRSTMDGYAVRARDTFGASETEPALLQISGEVSMGKDLEEFDLRPGRTVRIWTGGELPPGTDAAVMEEYTSPLGTGSIEVIRAVAPGENVIRRGEDIRQGDVILQAGTRLRPQELGLLAGLGITSVPIHRRPRVAILSTGDELVFPAERPGPGQIRDVNTTTLSALVRSCWAEPIPMGIVRDTFEELRTACLQALERSADLLLVSGGSSVGKRDFTIAVFESLPEAEILAHGVAIRPGKPTILARTGQSALFGLPGHVTSAMVVFHLFVRVLIARLSGARDPETAGMTTRQVRLTCNVPSAIGREEYLRVRMLPSTDGIPLAEPIFGRSGLITPLVQADGLLRIHRDTEGLDAGETAEVMLFP
jgi:molybdopterin molybdotransferase